MADAEFHIPVPHPLSHIILGPPRYSDGPFVMAILNDARVYMKLYGPPYPYTEKDWDDWYQIISSATSRNVEEPTAVKESHQGSGGADPTHENLNIPCTSKNTMWTFSIRQIVQSDSGGKEEFIGAIGVSKDSFLFILDEEERRKRVEENNSLEPGDPRIHWEIGFYLTPDCHGRGIMSAVLRTLISEILIPYMDVHILMGMYFAHNLASKAVFEKCGFRHLEVVPDAFTLPESKTGGKKNVKIGLGVLRWERDIATSEKGSVLKAKQL